MSQNKKTQKFAFLPMSSYLCNELCRCLDEPSKNGDCQNCAPPGEPCCIDCYCCLSPFGFILDILTCPFRGCYYCKNKDRNKEIDKVDEEKVEEAQEI